MLRRGLLISIARASRNLGGPAGRLARLASRQARSLARPDHLAPADSTPLDALPLTVVDCETTGLDVARDRVVSVAALRFHGPPHAPRVVLDSLVDPGTPIPAAATAVHGITDAMVAGAPAFRAAARRLAPLLRGAVLVGHAVGFDRAVLAAEARRAGLPWRDPPMLCTRELASALLPAGAGVELEALAARFNVVVAGRHTALGDAWAAAHVFAALAGLAGNVSLGRLRALGEEGRRRLAAAR
jgi:DNA polymerase III subunit epsilon